MRISKLHRISTAGTLAMCLSAMIAWGAEPKPASTVFQSEDGRTERGYAIGTAGARGIQKPTNPGAHALILTIGEYQGNIPKLLGVKHDAKTAAEIATRLGVPRENIVSLSDGELTLDGMRKALDNLETMLSANEQVFVYFSGHGGRQLIQQEGTAGERCAESLITFDGQAFSDVELEQRLKRIALKSQKTIVFLDACHSGGATTTRAISAVAPAYTAKSYSPPGQSCVKPTNVLTRNIMITKAPGSGSSNFVHIAAARDSEISLDQPGRGGVASQSWLACLKGGAKDTDESGGLSAREIQDCAQERINSQLANAQGFLPHNVTITGNDRLVMGYVATAQESKKPQSSQANVAIPSIAQKPLSVLSTLQDIHANRDDRKLVTMESSKSRLKIGTDTLDFTVYSREGGHLYLLMVGSDGTAFDMLFPNQLDQDNKLEPGATLRLPRPSWALTAGGPAGKNTVLAIVTPSPQDFANAGLKPSGPFSSAPAVAAKDIQLVTANQSIANPDCKNADLRVVSVRKNCLGSYGSTLLTIEEAH